MLDCRDDIDWTTLNSVSTVQLGRARERGEEEGEKAEVKFSSLTDWIVEGT